MTIRAYVHRKTRDLVCDAAEDGLRTLTPSLGAVDRAEVWTFEVEGDDATAEKTVHGILDRTTLVVNPNVHRYELESARQRGGAEDGTARITLTVRDLVDARGAAVLRSIRERRGIAAVTGVTRAVQWTIDLAGPVDAAEALAEKVSGGAGHGAGLLANRHCQDVHTTVEGA